MMRALSSEPDARILVSFFDLVTLITKSFFFMNMFTYYLAGIYFALRINEKFATIL